jgi:hypothetical protein
VAAAILPRVPSQLRQQPRVSLYQGGELVAAAEQRPEPNALEGVNRVPNLGPLQMEGTFGGLDPLVLVAVAVAPQQAIRMALVMAALQELSHFEFDGLPAHELSTELNGLGERSPSGGQGEELLFEKLTGELAFHGCPALSV